MTVELNPFAKLVRMLEQRLVRQRSALTDTELQLAGANDSRMRWDDEQLKKVRK